MTNCRTCLFVYCRVERTAHYNYEACDLGMLAPTPFVDQEACWLYKPAPEDILLKRKIHEQNINLFWQEPVEYKEPT